MELLGKWEEGLLCVNIYNSCKNKNPQDDKLFNAIKASILKKRDMNEVNS